jgi:hypothetical protein
MLCGKTLNMTGTVSPFKHHSAAIYIYCTAVWVLVRKLRIFALWLVNLFLFVRLHVTTLETLNIFSLNIMFFGFVKIYLIILIVLKSNTSSGKLQWTPTCVRLPSALEHANCSEKKIFHTASRQTMEGILQVKLFPHVIISIVLIKLDNLYSNFIYAKIFCILWKRKLKI